MWKLNSTLLNNHWVEEEIKRKKNYLEISENENTIYQILWYPAKAVLREKFIAMNTHIKKLEISQKTT